MSVVVLARSPVIADSFTCTHLVETPPNQKFFLLGPAVGLSSESRVCRDLPEPILARWQSLQTRLKDSGWAGPLPLVNGFLIPGWLEFWLGGVVWVFGSLVLSSLVVVVCSVWLGE